VIVATSAHFPVSMAAEWDDLTRDDIEAMRRNYTELHARGQRFAIFVDARRANVPSAPMRRALADMSNTFEAQSKKNAVCTAVVLNSPIMIGVLTAVQWFLKSEMELKYFARSVDAVAFIGEKLRAEGIAMPESAMRFAKKLDAATADQLPALFASVD
jgi:hypothetical protein